MKKIVELEGRWKAYKYRVAIFYLFIVVLIAFLLCLGLFVKFQYNGYFSVSKVGQKNVQEQILAQKPIENVVESNAQHVATQPVYNDNSSNPARINFVCRKVLSNKLMVRSAASFKSKPVGYYVKDGIFCASDDNVNGLVQTANGWITASDTYSYVVDVNMFVDSGFHKYQPTPVSVAKNDIEEIKVFDDQPNKPSSAQIAQPAQYPANPTANSLTASNMEPVKAKPVKPASPIEIVSEEITKERSIELKKADFNSTNSSTSKYETAMEVAEYYYDIKDYQNAIKWALNASNADSRGKSKTKSWIVYAKSLYALGKKEQAIEVLDKYVSNTNSRDALDVLNNMKKGVL